MASKGDAGRRRPPSFFDGGTASPFFFFQGGTLTVRRPLTFLNYH
jgi:hypothetical protein